MLKPDVLEKLNEQIGSELASAYAYYAMVAFFEEMNLKGFAHWMLMQAQEELAHAHRIFEYVIDKGERPVLGAQEAPKATWKTPLDAVDAAYKHECHITEMINECMEVAQRQHDHATTTMLHWFVSEQVEEEANANELVQKLKLVGDNPSALFLLDNELARRSAAPADPAN
jgi:ferritin